MEGSLSVVVTLPPHNLDIPHVLADSYTHTHTLVNCFGDVAGIMSIKNHLKDAFGFNGVLELAFLFIEDIWHNVQKRSGYIPS